MEKIIKNNIKNAWGVLWQKKVVVLLFITLLIGSSRSFIAHFWSAQSVPQYETMDISTDSDLLEQEWESIKKESVDQYQKHEAILDEFLKNSPDTSSYWSLTKAYTNKGIEDITTWTKKNLQGALFSMKFFKQWSHEKKIQTINLKRQKVFEFKRWKSNWKAKGIISIGFWISFFMFAMYFSEQAVKAILCLLEGYKIGEIAKKNLERAGKIIASLGIISWLIFGYLEAKTLAFTGLDSVLFAVNRIPDITQKIFYENMGYTIYDSVFIPGCIWFACIGLIISGYIYYITQSKKEQ